MGNKIHAILWKITGLVAIGLLIATFFLAYQALSLPETGVSAKLSGANPTIYLRSEPSGSSQIVTILERGSSVLVIDTVTSQNIIWMKIKTGQYTGWVLESNLVLESQ